MVSYKESSVTLLPFIYLILVLLLEHCWANVRSLAVLAAKLVSGRCQSRQMQSELLNELQTISMQDDFAKYARVKRKLNKLEIESTEYGKLVLKRSLWALIPAYIILTIISIVLAVSVRSAVAFALPADWLFPFATVLTFPTGQSAGTISMWWWLAVSRQLVNALRTTISHQRIQR